MRNISLMMMVLIPVGLTLSLLTIADDRRIDIKTDLKGEFFIVHQEGPPDRPILVVKNTGTGFTNYIKREFDCDACTVRYLGSGPNLEQVAADRSETRGLPIEEGTIPDQLARIVCAQESTEAAVPEHAKQGQEPKPTVVGD